MLYTYTGICDVTGNLKNFLHFGVKPRDKWTRCLRLYMDQQEPAWILQRVTRQPLHSRSVQFPWNERSEAKGVPIPVSSLSLTKMQDLKEGFSEPTIRTAYVYSHVMLTCFFQLRWNAGETKAVTNSQGKGAFVRELTSFQAHHQADAGSFSLQCFGSRHWSLALVHVCVEKGRFVAWS
jgi:hypothetical protein